MPLFDYLRDPAEITRRSFQIIAAEADFSLIPDDLRPIAERIVHACGMPDAIADLAALPGAAEAGRVALAAGGPIVCDVRTTAAGVMAKRLPARNAVLVAIEHRDAPKRAEETGQTRSAAGMELLAEQLSGALVVIGNAPTALFRLLELIAAGAPKPALVLGFPVGFVGAAESKRALADSGLPFVTLHGRRGGSAIAAAAVNALILGAAE